ncbi:MAG: sigma-70 family RNA polymerase sigma factor [Cytophagaceae bacterium]|jgi:RNA polymerase sigma-70 factor (ECF subfamily)|nr:sigma-70 family RNA polymerase sigma factor [Cytophagaceae bacterium]
MPSVCEEKEFQSLYKSHAKPLRNFLYYKSGDLKLSEDVCQEAMIRMWENCKDVIFEKAKSYLYTISMRLFLNIKRHEKIKLRFAQEMKHLVNDQDPSYLLREKEFGLSLQDAISDMPEGQREVFLMNRIDKMSYAEIAEALDLSVKAIEKRMHLALLFLKERVEELKTRKI